MRLRTTEQSKDSSKKKILKNGNTQMKDIVNNKNILGINNVKGYATTFLDNIRNVPKELKESFNDLSAILNNQKESNSMKISSILAFGGLILIWLFIFRKFTT